MALFLEFDERKLRAHRPATQSPRDPALHTAFAKFIGQFETISLTSHPHPHTGRQVLTGCFLQRHSLGVSALCKFWVELGGGRAGIRLELLQEGRRLCIRSSEMVKNICRTVRWINSMAVKTLPAVAVGPRTGQLRVCLQSQISYNCAQTIFAHLRSCLVQAHNFLTSFLPLLLYAANLAPRAILHSLPHALKSNYFGPTGDLTRYAQIFELLPCVNCPLEAELQVEAEIQGGERREGRGRQKNSSPKRIIQLYYAQCENAHSKEIQLFRQPPLFIAEKQVSSFSNNALALGFPSPKESNGHRFIFNTITVTNYDKSAEKYVAEGGRAKIITSPTRFFYSKSYNLLTETRSKKGNGEESTAETEQMEAEADGEQSRVEIEKLMLVKMPRVGPKDKDWRKIIDHIRYEKAILCNLRTVGCAYLPKYYHSVQKGYEYRPFLLMDYVPGNTLLEEMQRRQFTITLSAKLHILSHLFNAVRFLEQHEIAHLDITPSNVIVCKDYLVKLIDFGEAYHKATSAKFSQETPNKFIYSPGRTFPYAPPETSLRLANFTSQQDMYSLGVILFQLLFGVHAFTCSQDMHKRLYREGNYAERILLAPERAEDYGQVDIMWVLMNLGGKMMESDQMRRPFPVWGYIIIKKLFYALR